MRPFKSFKDWEYYWKRLERTLRGKRIFPLPRAASQTLPPISFPVVVKDGSSAPLGVMAFFMKKVTHYLESPGRISINSENEPFTAATDFFLLIEPCIRNIINKYYPFSADFLSFRINQEITYGVEELNRNKLNLRIDGSSFNLALLFYTLLGSVQENLKERIALTGILREENGRFSIGRVEHLAQKLLAVAGYKIDKFFIPEENIKDIEKVIKNGNLSFDIVPVATPEDVLEALFGDFWFEESVFRGAFDLKYRYQQHILSSDLVRIRNVVTWSDQDGYSDIGNYVRLKMVEKKEIESKIIADPSAEPNTADPFNKYIYIEKTTSKSPPVIPSTVMAGLVDSNKKVTIYGEAGSGKSTILRKLLHQACNEEDEKLKNLLPIFVELRHFSWESNQILPDALESTFLEGKQPGISTIPEFNVFKAYIQKLRQDNKVLYLMDAYDEMYENAEKFWDHAKRDVKKGIITSRYKAITSGSSEEMYEVLPLEDQNRKTFLKKYINDPDDYRKVLRFIDTTSDSSMKHLFSNPLMLNLLVILINHRPFSLDLASITRTDLIINVIEVLIDKMSQRRDIPSILYDTGADIDNFIIQLLSRLAFKSFYKARISKDVIIAEVYGISNIPQDKINSIIEDVTTGMGILEEIGIRKLAGVKTYYRFFHQVFQEFLVAKYVVDEISNDSQEFRKFINTHKFDKRYEIVFRFIAGLLDMEIGQQKKLETFFDTLLGEPFDMLGGYNKIIAARCFCEVKNSNTGNLGDLVKDLFSLKNVLLVPLLVELGHKDDFLSDSVSTGFIEWVNDKDFPYTRETIYALGELGLKSRNVLEILIDRLEDEDSLVRWAAASAVGKIGFEIEEVVKELFDKLEDKDGKIRSNAQDLLKNIGAESDWVVEELLDRVKDKNQLNTTRESAALVLSDIAVVSDPVVKALLVGLQDEDSLVRSAVVYALEKIGAKSKELTAIFVDLLKNEKGFIRQSAASALGCIGSGSERTIEALLEGLYDEDLLVRSETASALGKIGVKSERVAEALVDKLEEDFLFFDEKPIITALGNIGVKSERVVEALLNTVEDGIFVIRKATVAALGKLGAKSEKVVEALVHALEDEYIEVHLSAVLSLSQIGMKTEKAVEAIINRLDENGYKNETTALWSLYKVASKSKNAIKIFSDRINHEDDSIRAVATYALCKIGGKSKKMVEALFDKTEDKVDYICDEASTALGKIAIEKESVMEELIDKLGHKDISVRRRAAKILIEVGSELEKAVEVIINSQNENYDFRLLEGGLSDIIARNGLEGVFHLIPDRIENLRLLKAFLSQKLSIPFYKKKGGKWHCFDQVLHKDIILPVEIGDKLASSS